MRDVFWYTNMGGHSVNWDALRYSMGSRLCCALCDGLNGTPFGNAASAFVAEAVLKALEEGGPPGEAIRLAAGAYEKEQKKNPELAKALTTAAALTVEGNACAFATLGDTRVYRFAPEGLLGKSEDDSAAYEAYRSGEILYRDIRSYEGGEKLTACVGEGEADPGMGAFTLNEGDGLLLCTDGFWRHVYEEEMYVDFLKAASAKDWTELMLLRLVERSMLQGDNLSAFSYLYKGEKA